MKEPPLPLHTQDWTEGTLQPEVLEVEQHVPPFTGLQVPPSQPRPAQHWELEEQDWPVEPHAAAWHLWLTQASLPQHSLERVHSAPLYLQLAQVPVLPVNLQGLSLQQPGLPLAPHEAPEPPHAVLPQTPPTHVAPLAQQSKLELQEPPVALQAVVQTLPRHSNPPQQVVPPEQPPPSATQPPPLELDEELLLELEELLLLLELEEPLDALDELGAPPAPPALLLDESVVLAPPAPELEDGPTVVVGIHVSSPPSPPKKLLGAGSPQAASKRATTAEAPVR